MFTKIHSGPDAHTAGTEGEGESHLKSHGLPIWTHTHSGSLHQVQGFPSADAPHIQVS